MGRISSDPGRTALHSPQPCELPSLEGRLAMWPKASARALALALAKALALGAFSGRDTRWRGGAERGKIETTAAVA
jgi:hypothetical protein